MFIGIDIGTSGIKCVLVDEQDTVLGSESCAIEVSRPHPHWSEQAPELWWEAVQRCLDTLSAEDRPRMHQVTAMGLSGQMLGPVLLDRSDRPLRPCILWNDGRAVEESGSLLAAMPNIGMRTGCNPNPGFAAPKLMWLARHEPDVFADIHCILLPKDYVRLCLTGEKASEPTDAGGTHLLDVATGHWAPDLCELVGISIGQLPALVAPFEAAGALRREFADRWALRPGLPVAAGVGDNMGGCLGVGVGRAGEAVLSLGTSGVVSIVNGEFHPIPDRAVITHAHALPGTFLSMGVVLSATSTLDWACRLLKTTPAEFVALASSVRASARIDDAPLFLPYLSGLRTPHDRPQARGLFQGLSLDTDPALLAWSVLEGIAFHVLEAVDCQRGSGIEVDTVQFVGGGSRSRLWGEMLASLLDLPLHCPKGGEVGAALGAARLAMVATGLGNAEGILCRKPETRETIEPVVPLADALRPRFTKFLDLQSAVLDRL